MDKINKIGLNSNADARVTFEYDVDADCLEDALIQAFQEHVSKGFSARIADVGIAIGENQAMETFKVNSVKILTGAVVKVDYEILSRGSLV